MSAPLLIEGAWVLTLDAAGTAGPLGIVVQDDRFVDVGRLDLLRARHPNARVFDASDTVAIPGLVNAHLHPETQLLKGWVEGLDLHAWRRAHRFNDALTLLGTPAGRPWQHSAVRASLADCLLHGTTSVATYGVTVGADEVAAMVLEELGLNGHVTIRDAAFAPHTDVPAWRAAPPRMYRLHAEEALTDDELAAAADAAARGERIVMHAAETRARVRLARRRHGTTTIRLLERHGLLSPRTLLSHAVHVDAEECDVIARCGACVVASPAAEMKLGDGVAPLARYIERGVPVALGTDSAACNNGNDLLLEARLLGLTQALVDGPGTIPALELLRCATVRGAQVLGGAGEYGSIEAGLRADLVLLDARNARLQPLGPQASAERVAADVVYAATGRDVRDVLVAGRWKVRNGALTGVDGPALWRDLAAAAHDLGRALA